MPKHYLPPGKKKQGNAAKYITRTKAVHYLQTSLPNFRKLCILKGIFPRDPKKKIEGNHKTYYHMKDILFLLHDPLLQKFRDIRAHKKKIKKAMSKKNKDLVNRLQNRLPTYKLDRLVLERYPTFIDALRDLDDCLTMVHLFASLPAVESERIEVDKIHTCRRLSHEWQAYISRTHSLRKTFISVKGIYYQAEVEGQKITWLTPHALQQVLTDDVDFNVMFTFLEFYQELLGSVNFKLYHSLNLKYPPITDPRLEALADELYALFRYVASGSRKQAKDSQKVDSSSNAEQATDKGADTQANESELRLAQLEFQLTTKGPSSLSSLIDNADDENDEDDETKECRKLFENLKFFLSREVPRESLLFIIRAFGGEVCWEGDGSPCKESDESIHYQIVDRPTQGHLYLSREYVQPQWVYDCVNARIILPTEAYLIGRVPPPHLSPFVDDEAEGYVPEYAETIRRLRNAAKGHVQPMPGLGHQDLDVQHNMLAEGISDRVAANEASEKKQKLLMLEKQYHEELKMELQGVTYSSSLPNNDAPGSAENMPNEDTTIDPERDIEDENNRATVNLSRKTRKLYEAMQIGKKRKKAHIDLLKERKKKAMEGKNS